jgi:mannose-6-phosphate isomerase-like protein (cupin superfamily)
MDYLKDILDAKRNNRVLLIKDFCLDTPNWNEFIDYIDKSSKYNYPGMPTEPNDYDKSLGAEIIGSIMLKKNFYYYIASAERPMNETVEDISSRLSYLFKKNGGVTATYINLISNITNIPQHEDPQDNFYWQCIGEVEWESGDKKYKVEPGDLMYIPAKVSHGVNFNMPRAAIGFTWDLQGY